MTFREGIYLLRCSYKVMSRSERKNMTKTILRFVIKLEIFITAFTFPNFFSVNEIPDKIKVFSIFIDVITIATLTLN